MEVCDSVECEARQKVMRCVVLNGFVKVGKIGGGNYVVDVGCGIGSDLYV